MKYPNRAILKKRSQFYGPTKVCNQINSKVDFKLKCYKNTKLKNFHVFKTGAITHLGEPIKQKGFRLSDSKNFLTSEQAQFQVNVEGPNDKGELFGNVARFKAILNLYLFSSQEKCIFGQDPMLMTTQIGW